MSDASGGRPPRGLARDLHRAREGTKASAEELREFVRQFRGKNPQEMLGLVAGSGLVRSTILATVLTVGFMAVFTIWPYLTYEPKATAKANKPAAAPSPAPAPTASTPAAPAAAATADAAKPAAPPTAATGTPKQPDVLQRLGIGETKASDPKKNPLEAGADDLLKDLK
jgi:cytoskeletal protein RodZ